MPPRGLGGALKKQRTDDAATEPATPAAPPPQLGSPISAALLSEASRASLRAAYAAATPFTHGVLRPLCDEARLRAVFEEMRAHLSGTFKETDLFKVRQPARALPVCVAQEHCARAAPLRRLRRSNQP